jgi:hypothetical protein
VAPFDDSNSNGVQDGIEGIVSGVIVTLFDGQEIVGTETSDTLAGRVCFEGLTPGPFMVFQAVPSVRQMTTADSLAVELQAGQTVEVRFGSVAVAPPSEATAVAATDSEGGQGAGEQVPSARVGISDALYAVSGIVVLLMAAVLIGIYFIYSKRK